MERTLLHSEHVRTTLASAQRAIDAATTEHMEDHTELWEDALESMEYFSPPEFHQYAAEDIAEAHDATDDEWVVGEVRDNHESWECVLTVATGDVRVRDAR